MIGRRWKQVTLASLAGLVLAVGLGIWLAFRQGLIERVYVYQEGRQQLHLSATSPVRSVTWSIPEGIPEGNSAPNPPPSDPHWGSPVIVVTAEKTANGDFDIHARELAVTGWTASTPLAGKVNSTHDEVSPVLAPNGSFIIFASNRPGGLGGFDLYLSRRSQDGWERPTSLGSLVNSPYDEKGAAYHPTGAVLAFATNRPRGFLLTPPQEWDDVPLESWKAGSFALAYVTRALKSDERGKWSEVRALEQLFSRADDLDPAFSSTGAILYFASSRAGGAGPPGSFDIYRSRVELDSDPATTAPELIASTPENAGRPLNSEHDDVEPNLLLDGHAMTFRVVDMRRGVSARFESRTREVETGLEVAKLPLRALGENALRIAILLGSGLMLVLMAFLLFRHREAWTTSLLVRSGVLAVVAHIGMLYAFYFWVVSHSIVASAEKQAPQASVSIERTLQAKVTAETMRLDLEALAKAEPAPVSHAATTRAENVLPVDPSASIPETAALAPLPSPAPAFESTATPPEVRAVNEAALVFDAAKTVPDSPSPAPPLPTAEPTPQEASPEEVATPSDRSLKSATELPRPGPIGTMAEQAPSQAQTTAMVMQAAATQTQAFVPELASLPPLARSSSNQPEIVTPLDVPAQAQEVANEQLLATPRSSPRAAIGDLAPTTDSLSGPPQVNTTELAATESPWRSQIPGILATSSPVEEAREFRQAELALAREPRTVSGAATKLKEKAPVAEVASAARDTTPDLSPRASERATLAASETGTARAPAVSLVTRPESRPLTAESSALTAPMQASPARLDAMPQPGMLRDALSARLEPSSLRPERATLREGESGTRPAAGARAVADVLSPKRAAVREWHARAREPVTPPSPRAATVTTEPVRAASPGAVALVQSQPNAPAQPSTPSLAPPSLPERAPTLVAAVQKLAETPPPTRAESDIRKLRSAEVREAVVQQMGGNQASEDAVRLALNWLARHQSPDGRWDIDGFDAQCQGCRSPGVQVDCDAAVTGLALLCFLGQNHTPNNKESPFRRQAQLAIDWLLKLQAPNGSLAGPDDRYTMYTHGIATLALSEAYILTRDQRLELPVRRAVDLIIAAQNKQTGGWRYKPEPPLRGDTSISGWQILALVSARGAEIAVPEVVFDRARHWFDVEVAGGQHGGIYGYTRPEEPRVAMTAEGMFARLLLGAQRSDRNIEEAARYIHTETRGGGYLDNLYLLYYGNLALYHYQGWIWERWNVEVRDFLTRSQQQVGPLTGSWDPTGFHTETGGRVLATCFATLTLEVYYRYLPLYWTLDKTPQAPR